MTSFAKNSQFLKINVNDKQEANVLDLLLKGEGVISINNEDVDINTISITYIQFVNNIAYVILSPRVITNIKNNNDKDKNKDAQ